MFYPFIIYVLGFATLDHLQVESDPEPDLVFLIYDGKPKTYAEFRIRNIAPFLHLRGVSGLPPLQIYIVSVSHLYR